MTEADRLLNDAHEAVQERDGVAAEWIERAAKRYAPLED